MTSQPPHSAGHGGNLIPPARRPVVGTADRGTAGQGAIPATPGRRPVVGTPDRGTAGQGAIPATPGRPSAGATAPGTATASAAKIAAPSRGGSISQAPPTIAGLPDLGAAWRDGIPVPVAAPAGIAGGNSSGAAGGGRSGAEGGAWNGPTVDLGCIGGAVVGPGNRAINEAGWAENGVGAAGDDCGDEPTVDLGQFGGLGGDDGGVPPFNGRRAAVVGAVAALVVSGVGLIAYSVAGDVPRGTRVLGADLGGLSRGQAERVLGKRAATSADAPLRVRLDGNDVQVAPDEIGLRIDVDASVGRAIRSGTRFVGGHEVGPVVRIDRALLERRLRDRLGDGRVTMRRPGITIRGVTVLPSYPEIGLDLDVDGAVEAAERAWPEGAVAEVSLVERTPVTTRAEVDAMVETLARPAVAAPVTVRVGERAFVLTPKAIGKGLIFRSDTAGRLTPEIDIERLREAAADELAEVETPPRPAAISIVEGRPRIAASAPGMRVDLAKLDLLRVLPKSSGRTVVGVLVPQKPPISERALARLGITERVSTFTTNFSGGRTSPRTRNIVTIAEEVDGAIVLPGEVFSLNAHTGERDYAAGYHDAPVIVGGKLEPGVGGGASQFTTTLFNAAYYAGLQDVEHKPHSFYFDRYPAVIESTIFYPTLDLKFRNTTPYGILIATATTDRSVTVTLWSTRVYDSVRTEYGPRRNRTMPPTVHRPAGPRCLTSSGLPGFTQDAWRIIRKDGREVERRKFSWRYDPEPRFVCGPTP